MDVVASCKEKLAYLRMKELKDVLTHLGLSKQGKKQDLVDRILAILNDEQVAQSWAKKNAISKENVATLVADIHRKMQVYGASDLASKGQSVLESNYTEDKGEIYDSFHLDIKVRCLCGNSLETNSMIKCEDPRCQVWQHIRCVIVPEKPMEGDLQYPELFYCEICRLNRADPFWVTVAHPLHPVKLVTANIPLDGSSPMQGAEKTFPVTRADKDLLMKQGYEVQAWCMLLNDKVPFRMHWPQYADLQINGVPVRAINRPGPQLLGANGRDDGPVITPFIKDGVNKISLTGRDARVFCLGVRIVRRQTVQEILNCIPKESDGEHFGDALTRVCRCISGGTATDNVDSDSDSDIEVVADSCSVNLRCPIVVCYNGVGSFSIEMSGSRMKVAGRFKPCAHMGCFDLEVFVEMTQRSKKWQCPICLKNYSLEHLIIDPYFNRITTKMRQCDEDVTEIDVQPDGCWRVKTKTEAECKDLGELAQWHNPNGTSCNPDGGELNSKAEIEMQIKQEEGYSEGHTSTGLKLGIQKICNGFWGFSKPEDIVTSSYANWLEEKVENCEQKIIPMSSSLTVSGRDGEDPSVNQDGTGILDLVNNGTELDSLFSNVDSFSGFTDWDFSVPLVNNEVIVLSDSDDDIDILRSSGSVYDNNLSNHSGASFLAPPSVIGGPYSEDPSLASGGNFCVGLFNLVDEFGMPLCPLPSGTVASPVFQLFSSDVPDPLTELGQGLINCPPSLNGYGLAPETALGSASLAVDCSVSRPNVDINDGLVDNPLAFGGEDPTLQIFLPTRPSDASAQSSMRDQTDVSIGVRTDDWISLRLGAQAMGNPDELSPSNVVNLTQQMLPGEGATESTVSRVNSASMLLGTNDDRSEKENLQKSDNPFSFPRQKRSGRPRLYLSFDSDRSS